MSQHGDTSDALVMLGKHAIKLSDIVKLLGLFAFMVLTFVIAVLLWPSFSLLFEENGVQKLIDDLQSQGALGAVSLLGMQFIQIVMAFIPGEVVQAAAGVMYGPLWGTLILLLGGLLSSAVIYELVHRLGAPFVHSMVDEKYLEKFYSFERSGKLNIVVFVLFLIPGMPKDVFTYVVPLTDMRMAVYLTITTVGRIPGIIMTTYAAAGLAEGEITSSLIIFAIAAIVLVLGIMFRNQLLEFLSNREVVRRRDEKKGGALMRRLEEAEDGFKLDIPGDEHEDTPMMKKIKSRASVTRPGKATAHREANDE